MNRNIGTLDRNVRVILGLSIVALGVYAQSWLGAIGLVPLVTGLARRCPMYIPLGLDTGKADKANQMS